MSASETRSLIAALAFIAVALLGVAATFVLGTVSAVNSDRPLPGTPPASIGEGLRAWTMETGFSFLGRRATATFADPGALIPATVARSGLPLDLFSRHWKTQIRLHLNQSDERGLVAVEPDSEYVLDVALQGRGQMALVYSEFDASGRQIGTHMLATFEMSEKQNTRRFGRLFVTSANARYLQPAIFASGRMTLEIPDVSLLMLGPHDGGTHPSRS